MENEKWKGIKKQIVKEMAVEDEESWMQAKEIFKENANRLKPRISIETIYNRIRELKKE